MERIDDDTEPAQSGEVVGLDQSIAYARTIADEAAQHAPTGNEAYLAHLYASDVTGAGLTSARQMQDAFATAQVAADRHATELDKQRTVQAAYDQAPDAGDKTYLTGTDHAGAAPQANAAPTDPKGTPVTTDHAPGQAEPRSGQASGYRRCDACGYVLKPQMSTIQRCPNCMTGTEFTPTTTHRPALPSDEAVNADTRDVEAQIRTTYAQLADHPGDIVPLADLRAALPDNLPRETVDAALSKLAAHPDVHIIPRRDHHQTDPRTQAAAVPIGGEYNHQLFIEEERSPSNLLLVLRDTDAAHATSIVAPLDEREVQYVAERMGVDPTGPTETVRERIVAQSAANRDARLADGRQKTEDSTLLHRADNDPEWAPPYVRERADRWANQP